MEIKEILDTVVFKTCIVRREIVVAPDGAEHEWKAAYSLVDGSYIGNCELAEFFEKKGILPQTRPGGKTSSIGFCEKEQTWAAWSHRAMSSFGIGSKVKKGDCAYCPTDAQDMLDDMTRFWVDSEDEYVTETKILRQELDVTDPNSYRPGLGLLLDTERTRKKDGELLSSIYWEPYPDVWGKGDWEAKTLDDAKEMAIAFARSVS